MKKIFTFALALLAVLSMTSCQTEAENSTTTQANASQSLKNDLQVTDKDRVQDDLLPELIPDGEYGVNLDGEQVVYDKQGIKITYVGLAFNVGVCDDFNFRVENNTDGYILFDPSSIVLNGVSFSTGNSDATAAHTTEEISVGMLSEERERFISSQDDIRCFDMTFSILGDSNEYGTSGELVADGLTYVFTRGQHDHRNDGRVIKGELIFENELLALYVENSLVKKGDKL